MRVGIVRAASVAAIMFTATLRLTAQAPAFEVAAIKSSTENSPPIAIKRTAAQFVTSNTSLAFLIRWAYDLDQGRLVGAAKELESARFDILAKIPAGELAAGQLQLMMKSLLRERFHLRIHQETRQLSSYTLAVDQGGPKVNFVDLGEGFGQNPFRKTDRGRLIGTKVTATMLAKALAGEIGRPVEDVTSLERPFDFVLEWAPDMDVAGPGAEPSSNGMSMIMSRRPSIFTAIKAQLGLKLVSHKSPVEVVVIDGVSTTPTDN